MQASPHSFQYCGHKPVVADDVYIAPRASVIGRVRLASQASIWFGAVLRGDVQPIQVGARSNIQDNCVLHATQGVTPTIVGEDCTVGHSAILHGCALGDRVLIGMGAILLDQAEIASDSMVAAGSLVTSGKRFEPGMLIMGRPAKAVRALGDAERAALVLSAAHYVELAGQYRDGA